MILNCKHCSAFFQEGPGIPIMGKSPEAKDAELLARAMGHIQGAHPQEAQEMMLMAGQFNYLLLMSHLDTDESKAKVEMIRISALVCRSTMREVSDEQIRTRCLRYFPGLPAGTNAEQLLRDLRDYLTYADILSAPSQPQPTGEVTQ